MLVRALKWPEVAAPSQPLPQPARRHPPQRGLDKEAKVRLALPLQLRYVQLPMQHDLVVQPAHVHTCQLRRCTFQRCHTCTRTVERSWLISFSRQNCHLCRSLRKPTPPSAETCSSPRRCSSLTVRIELRSGNCPCNNVLSTYMNTQNSEKSVWHKFRQHGMW